MPKEIIVNTKFADYDGLTNVVFQDESNKEIAKFGAIPFNEEKEAIESQLNEDEKSGTKFGLAIRRYIIAKYGVPVSIDAAFNYYKSLCDMVEEARELFYPSPDASGSTESTSATGQMTESE
jgi:hypothetical protein